jgi:Amidase
MSAMRSSRSGELHELGLLAAARAIRNGEVSSAVSVGKLLERASGHADFNAFITIDEAPVREAARQADRSLRAGRSAPWLGARLAVKDSYLTKGLTTTFGTSVLATFKPTRDAVAVARVKDAGAMVDCFRAGQCAVLSDHSVCSAPDGASVEVPGGRQRRHRHLPGTRIHRAPPACPGSAFRRY